MLHNRQSFSIPLLLLLVKSIDIIFIQQQQLFYIIYCENISVFTIDRSVRAREWKEHSRGERASIKTICRLLSNEALDGIGSGEGMANE